MAVQTICRVERSRPKSYPNSVKHLFCICPIQITPQENSGSSNRCCQLQGRLVRTVKHLAACPLACHRILTGRIRTHTHKVRGSLMLSGNPKGLMDFTRLVHHHAAPSPGCILLLHHHNVSPWCIIMMHHDNASS